MHTNEFEQAFGDFLETLEHEQILNIVFTSTRQAFLAGWLAAKGEPPTPHRLFEIIPGKDGESSVDEQ
ncbi:hypothetical protein LJC63_00570 [Ruminococcaceae bacterium OttesenSCG-928-L11]|nr:hypothetical protein [Ruminococcaceae bacterium OttesenSCG-928-L11]